MKFKQFFLRSFASPGYTLTPVEFKDAVPFTVQRMYYIRLQNGAATNQHCHKKEAEVFILVNGSVTLIYDAGAGKEELKLAESGAAILIPEYVWHGFKDASEGCLIIALSSTNYNPDRSDYLENYEDYLLVRDQELKV